MVGSHLALIVVVLLQHFNELSRLQDYQIREFKEDIFNTI